MSEKEKRKEKPKHKAKPAAFKIVSLYLLFLLLVGVGMLFYILLRPDPSILPFEGTRDYIETQNAINLTLISVSATSAILNATATAEAEQGQ